MATKNPHGLTDKQWACMRRYVEQGFKDVVGSYQYGFPKCKSDNAAKSAFSRLLTNVNVAAYLADVKAKAQERTQITADRVLEELGKLGFVNMADYAEWGPEGVTLKGSEGMTRDMLAAVSEVSETVGEKGGSIKFKLHDKVSALEKIGKHFGMFTDRRADEYGGEPAPEEMTPERMVSLWERVERVKTIKQFERMLVEASKKQLLLGAPK